MSGAPVWILMCLLVTGRAGGGGPVDAGALARVRAFERAQIKVIADAAPAVVCMFDVGRQGGGAGVIIDPEGYGLTNHHVVAGMAASRMGLGGLSDHHLYEYEVLGVDPTGDVAMFKLVGRRRGEPSAVGRQLSAFAGRPSVIWPWVPLGDSDAVRAGDGAIAMGNPFGLAEDYTPTVTLGIISGVHRYQWGMGRALRYTDCIQTDTPVNPGNSGGPLFDSAGRVVGINGRISLEERGRINVGVGYAISVNQIKRFIPALWAGYAVKHATAGFTVMNQDGVVLVDRVLAGASAFDAGMRSGDRIVRFGGKTIRTANQFLSLLGTYPGGWPVEVVYQRGGTTERARFRLRDLPFPGDDENLGSGKDAARFEKWSSHAVSGVANRRAVRRAVGRFQDFVGGRETAGAVRFLRARGAGLRSGDSVGDGVALDVTESAADIRRPGAPADHGAVERAVRWAVLTESDDPAVGGRRVIGGDEVRGSIAVVLRWEAVGVPVCLVAFDDGDGRLLRIAFEDPVTGEAVRYEYGDYRRSGALKLPHVRWVYVDGELRVEERFEEVLTSSRPL